MAKHQVCDGCGRKTDHIHARHESLAFCASCYKREFKKVQCPNCGKGTRAYRNIGKVFCKSCRVKDRKCSGCAKPLLKASKTIGDDAYCWPCSRKLRDPQQCAMCGQMALSLSKSPSLRIDERICKNCRERRTHFSCTSCGKYRKPAGIDTKGQIVCKTCLENENYICPRCKKPGKRHSRTRCQDCYWKDHAREKIQQGANVLTRPWTQYAFREFGESLINIYGGAKASHRIPKYVPLFVSLDVRYYDPASITSRNLIKTFGSEILRRNSTAINFLIREEIVPAFLSTEVKHYNEIKRQEKLIEKVQGHWYGPFLSRFYTYTLRLQQISLDRGNKGPSARTVTTWLLAARRFLEYVSDIRKLEALTQIETYHLELFLAQSQGYKASIRRFIRFLNKEGRLFRPVQLDTVIPKNSARNLLDFGKVDQLLRHFLTPEIPAKEALFGLFMLLYAQSPERIRNLKLKNLGRDAQGVRTILFYRAPIKIMPEIDKILSCWLEERKALCIHESEHSNPYLFPGRRIGDKITSASIRYYYKKWGVRSDQLLCTSLFQIYCNGVRHPNVPHHSFGVSKAMSGKYFHIFDAHYKDAVANQKTKDG